MADTHEVIQELDLSNTKSKLLAIVANTKGAIDACKYDSIDYLGFPFSVSETFQLRNTNTTIIEAVERLREIQQLCVACNKKLIVYISMGFGNPYNDPYNPDIVLQWVEKLAQFGVKIFSISDTIGVADTQTISYLYKTLIPHFPDLEFGAHLHSAPHNWFEKIQAAREAGCERFDSAIGGFGGCPMAADTLVGNMNTENIINLLNKELPETFNMTEFEASIRMAKGIFP
jgi:hydroxymethylglutaryl-CoA lyase